MSEYEKLALSALTTIQHNRADINNVYDLLQIMCAVKYLPRMPAEILSGAEAVKTILREGVRRQPVGFSDWEFELIRAYTVAALNSFKIKYQNPLRQAFTMAADELCNQGGL